MAAPLCYWVIALAIWICSQQTLDAPGPAPYCHNSPDPDCEPPEDNSASTGDPHFLMWGGERFSYQGECDIVLLDSASFGDGAGLRIHVRTAIREFFSFIESAAFQIDNNVLEIRGTEKFYMNGEEVKAPVFLGKYPIEYINSSIFCEVENCAGAVMTKIDFGIDGYVLVKIWKGHLHVNLYASADGFLDSVGVLGIRKKPGKFDRHGKRMFKINDYAEGWQVRDWEPQLFKEARYPQYPKRCVQPPNKPVRKIQDGFFRLAEEACAKAIDGAEDVCIFDVLATRDIEMAIPYTF